VEFEGDGREAVVSLRRYRVNFADAATVLSCEPSKYVPAAWEMFLVPLKAAADYISPPYVVRPGEGEVQNRSIYNTHAYSKGNHGHEFTKVLTDAERRALLEYLKTL